MGAQSTEQAEGTRTSPAEPTSSGNSTDGQVCALTAPSLAGATVLRLASPPHLPCRHQGVVVKFK